MIWSKIKEFIKKREILELVVVLGFFCLCLLLMFGCAGSQPIETGSGSSTKTPTEALSDAVSGTNWLVSLSAFGVFGSIVAMGVGLRREGGIALVASIGSAVYVMTVIRYAWLMALAGLVIGAFLLYQAWKKNRETVNSFVDGFQHAKYKAFGGTYRKVLNEAMADKLTPEAERLVKKRKAQLEKQNGKQIKTVQDQERPAR